MPFNEKKPRLGSQYTFCLAYLMRLTLVRMIFCVWKVNLYVTPVTVTLQIAFRLKIMPCYAHSEIILVLVIMCSKDWKIATSWGLLNQALF